MDSKQKARLAQFDTVLLGRNVRSARMGLGLTQKQLAGPSLSIAYISRIEAGQRRPSPPVMEQLATRLNATVDQLLAPATATKSDEFRLTLDYAELALETGETLEAQRQAASVESAVRDDAGGQPLVERARILLARTYEAQGRLDDAIVVLEQALEHPSEGLDWVKASIALSRCYRESGDFGRAIDLGEATTRTLLDRGLKGSDEAVQTGVTLAASYFERGDVGHAIRLCRKAIADAESSASPAARASAYWNASMLEAQDGMLATAIPLARKALALLAEGKDTSNLARLRSQLGIMLLQLDPPELEEAESVLQRAGEEFRASSASRVDVARNQLGRARRMYLARDYSGAEPIVQEVRTATREAAPLVAADAEALLGQLYAARQDLDSAKQSYMSAVQILTGVGADRTAAQLWLELGSLMEDIGEYGAARDAYRRAATSSGLRVRAALADLPRQWAQQHQ